jgi:hypothetical protein
MVLLDDSNRTGKTKKASTTCRGGFGAIARDAKSQAIAKKMTTLAKKCSWYLATTDKSSSAKMDKCLSYVKKFMTVKSESISYYLVRVLPEDSQLSAETTVRKYQCITMGGKIVLTNLTVCFRFSLMQMTRKWSTFRF